MFAVYSSMTEFISLPFLLHLEAKNESFKQIYGALLYLPWILKPLYGFLADWFFLFKYRIKGYVVILTSLNIVICLIIVFTIEYLTSSMFFVLVLLLYNGLAFIDAITRTSSSI